MSMGLLRLLRGNKASAPVARERLQILLAHERGMRGQPDLLGVLREEILAVVSRHVTLDPTSQTVRFDRAGVELDPSGIGKGYAVDRMADVLKRRGVQIALISGGQSSIYGLGAPPDEAPYT